MAKSSQWTNYRPNRLKKTEWENCTFIYRVAPSKTITKERTSKSGDVSPTLTSSCATSLISAGHITCNRMKIEFLLN